jgi:hypothetical protein
MSQIIDATLYVYYDDNSSFTDMTQNAWSQDSSKTVSFSLGANQVLYIGKEYTFNHRYFNFNTPQAGADIKIEYTNSSGLTEVENAVDNTFDFSQNGHIYFTLPSDWEKSTVNSKELYWLKITDNNATTGFILNTIKNLFADDSMVEDFLPNLTRYLPSGRADFLYLHELSKNEIVDDLKAGSHIDYEDQIKDESLIVLQQLGCYKFLELLLLPMIEDESIKVMQERFASFYQRRVDNIRLSVDSNKDQTVSDAERGKVSFSTIQRF